MNSDSYKIIISLSHHRIAFEYWLRDGENKLVPMPNTAWPVPLAFYCSPTGIEIGEAAMRAVHSGTSNAFDNYFGRLANDETYYYAGQTKPLRYLLLDAAETIFADFFKTVLLSSKGTLNDNRAIMPITIACESDIAPNERALLTNLFKDSGYNRSKVVEYNSFIENYIRSSFGHDTNCDNALVAWTEGTDLTFTLFGLKQASDRRQACYPGLGIDPRLEHVKGLIWDRVKGQNPWLMYDNEEEAISKAAADFLNSSSPLVSETIALSDGMSYHYSLNRAVVDNLQCSEGTTIRKKLEAFLADNGIINRSKTLLLLRGVAAGNIFFEQTLCQGFTNTVRSDRRLRSNTMNQLIADPNPVVAQDPNSHIPPQQAEPVESKEIYPPADTPKQKEIAEPPAAKPEPQIEKPEPAKPADAGMAKNMEREWREIRATAKGKIRGGNASDAVKILSAFLDKIEAAPGTGSLQESVRAELSAIKPAQPPVKPAAERPKPQPKPAAEKPVQAKPQPKEADKGEQFIAAGKLKDARDWYRAAGNSAKARLLSDLIRSQKGVEMRKSSLDDCRRTKNTDQIKRIVSELQDYISLCDQAKYNCDEYRKLLSEYKKIIK